MDRAEIPFLSAVELGELLRKREVSPVEATEAYLARIQEVEPKTNAYITVSGDEALAAARQAENEIAAGNYRGVLHGVPVAVKDQIHTRGIRTTIASRVRSEYIPDEDATVVTRLKEAGAVLLGKLNMAEMALGDPMNSAFGPAHNPWDLTRNPGTSSTGSGAATAAFLCATSLGEDTAGSIRHPAASCGLVGLRPSWGRVSRYAVDGASWSVDTIGPISRSVADCAVTIRAIAGHDPRDPLTRDVPVPDYQRALTGDIRGLKVGVPKECFDPDEVGVGQETADSVRAAIEVLKQLGADVREVSIPLTRHAGAIIRGITHPERVSIHPDWLREQGQDLHYNTRVAFMTGNIIPAEFYYKAQKLRVMIRQQSTRCPAGSGCAGPALLHLPSGGDGPECPRRKQGTGQQGVNRRQPAQHVQLGGHACTFNTVRLHLRGTGRLAPCPATCGQALRRGDSATDSPRLRAEHRVAPPTPSDLVGWRSFVMVR